MCGIFGFYSHKEGSLQESRDGIHELFLHSTSRGKEAAGLMVLQKTNHLRVEYIKSGWQINTFLQSEGFQSLWKASSALSTIAAIGHARMETHGTHLLEKNNQPIFSRGKKLAVVHNGIVVNYRELWKRFKTSPRLPDLDTQVVVDLLEQLLAKMPLRAALHRLYGLIEGTANLAILLPERETLVLSTNNGSVYWLEDRRQRKIWFASERVFLRDLADRLRSRQPALRIHHLRPMNALIISSKGKIELDLRKKPRVSEKKTQTKSASVSFKNWSEPSSASPHTSRPSVSNSLRTLQQHNFDYEKIYALRRCARCILPETTPFITFDHQGVCNYCHEHQPIRHAGKQALEEILALHRKGTGEPDCLVAFSGGRDSSYGLHLLKKEFGMTPLAYTYDWGMISDLGRRNQARVLGELGVEHILVSADIEMKRRHIRENILAWMKRPHLGMVPLFMQGDKQGELHAKQLMKKYDLPLMFFCRGNELEKEEFKAGHAGVQDADPGGVIHNLALANKLKLLSFYAGQYVRNPAYFNSSLAEVGSAFFATYLQQYDFTYLWHYLPWNEKHINRTLTTQYGWETSQETPTTWRIGDGTPAFYNYIYYQVQGFTENDSLRARQVREEILSRDSALAMVREENKPQYENLKWYFDMVGLDGHEVLSAVDAMPRLY